MPIDNTIGTKNGTSHSMGGAGETLSNAAGAVKRQANDLGQSVVDKLDDNRDAAAGGLAAAANQLRTKATSLPGGERVAGAAHSTADALDSTADYIRQHDISSMMDDVYKVVKNNPGPALLGAAALGFLLARSFSND